MASRTLLTLMLAGWLSTATAFDTLPPLRGDDLVTGQAIDLADYRGRVVLVDFWASWCPPCLESLPAYERLYQRHREEGFAVVAVNVDERTEDAQAFLERHPVSYAVVPDPTGRIGKPWNIRSLPRAFLLDPSGAIVLELKRFEKGDEEKLAREIARLLGH